MRQIFVLPADQRSSSGGDLYNRFLLAALRKAGAALSVMTIDEAIRDAERGRPARYWLDSLLLDCVPRFRSLLRAPSACFVIVHYFPSLQPAATARVRRSWRRMEDAAFACADGFLLTSIFSARELASRNLGHKPMFVVPPAPVVTPGRMARRPQPHFCALMAASLVSGKGVFAFLEGLDAHLESSDAFSLQIAGRTDADTAYAQRCRQLVDASAVLRDKVRFLGALRPAAMKRAYAGNAFFVSASRMETFGMALQEARLFGMYVLTLDAGHAAAHVNSPADGEILASMRALSQRVAQLVRDPAMCGSILAAMVAPPAPATWEQAATNFLALVRMPQRRTA